MMDENDKDNNEVDLDTILVEDIGQFGKYQITTLLLVSLPVIFSGMGNAEYLFTASKIPHRCLIPQCDNVSRPEYKPTWLANAVPGTSGDLDQCRRYADAATDQQWTNFSNDTCSAKFFDTNRTVECTDFVYENNNSVVYDYNLGCQEWKRSLIGTFFTIGTLLVLPVTGYISDTFGRRVALVVSAFNAGVLGLSRAWSNSYEAFLILELAESTLGAGAYSSSYVLATELVGPEWRVMAGVVIAIYFAIGLALAGAMAWLIPYWRTLTIVIYAPQVLVIFYFFMIPESIRWLLSRGKYQTAKKILRKAAKMNGRELPEKKLDMLITSTKFLNNDCETSLKSNSTDELLVKKIVKSPKMLKRVLVTPIWWITTTLIYYGLSINSVGLGGNLYLNFILVASIEVPADITAIYILNRMGRKLNLMLCFFSCAATLIAFLLVPENMVWLSLILFLFGKFVISTVFACVYIYTAELYPTQYRHSLLAFSSMVGRIGSIVAPLSPFLMTYWEPMPSVIFITMAILSGCLAFTTPETFNSKLPDTMAEAEAIGTKPDS